MQPDGKVGFEFEAKDPRRRARPRAVRWRCACWARIRTTSKPVELHAGRYGPYVKHGDVNATVPDRDRLDALTLDEAVELIAAKGGKAAPSRKPTGAQGGDRTCGAEVRAHAGRFARGRCEEDVASAHRGEDGGEDGAHGHDGAHRQEDERDEAGGEVRAQEREQALTAARRNEGRASDAQRAAVAGELEIAAADARDRRAAARTAPSQ